VGNIFETQHVTSLSGLVFRWV